MTNIFSKRESQFLVLGGFANLILVGIYVFSIYSQISRPVHEGADWYAFHYLFLYLTVGFIVAVPHLLFWLVMLVSAPVMVVKKTKEHKFKNIIFGKNILFYLVTLIIFLILYVFIN